jgi:O-antigen/teichoic acid export membrane protein
MSISRNYVYNLILNISQFLFSIITFPYVSRVLGITAIGITSYIETLSRYILIFAVLGIPIYGTRQLAKKKYNKLEANIVFVEIFSFQFFTSIFSTLIYFLILFYLNDFILYWKLYVMGGFLVLSNIISIEWMFQGLEEFKYIAVRTLLIRFISIILLFFFVKNKNDINIYFFLLIFTSVTNGLINYYNARKIFFITIITSINRLKVHIKPILISGSYLIAISIYTLLPILILGKISNSDSVGYYITAIKVNRISIIFFSTLSTILIPRLAYYASNNDSLNFQRTIRRSFIFIFSLGFPISVSIFLLAPELVSIFAGSEYSNTIICVQIMSPLVVIIGFAQVFSQQILIPFSKDKQNFISVFVGAIMSLFLNIFLIYFYDVIGASIVTLLIEIITTFISFYFANRIFKIKIPFDNFLKNLIFSFPYFIFFFFIKKYYKVDYHILLSYTIVSFIYFLLLQYVINKKVRLFLLVLLKRYSKNVS